MGIYRETAEEKEARVKIELEEAAAYEAIAEKEREQELKLKSTELKSQAKTTIVTNRQHAVGDTVQVLAKTFAFTIFIILCAPILIIFKREVPTVITEFFKL